MTASTRALRRPSLAALVVLLGGALGVTAQDTAVSPAQGTPRLVAEETSHDWGQLLKGQATEYTFTVRNDGDGALLIEKVQAT